MSVKKSLRTLEKNLERLRETEPLSAERRDVTKEFVANTTAFIEELREDGEKEGSILLQTALCALHVTELSLKTLDDIVALEGKAKAILGDEGESDAPKASGSKRRS